MGGGGENSGGDSIDKGDSDKDSIGSKGDGGNSRRGGNDAKLGWLEAGYSVHPPIFHLITIPRSPDLSPHAPLPNQYT